MPAWFVTGTGTDVGKTFVTQGLIRHLRARAIKPVISGFETVETSDSGMLLMAMGRQVRDVDQVSPWRFKAPLAPDMAAARENRTVPFEEVVEFSRRAIAGSGETPLLIEGVGGIMAPLDGTHTVLDWMRALGLPLVLVTGSYLGTISHTLTAVEVLRRNGLTVAVVPVSESAGSPVPLSETMATLTRFLNPIKVVAVPRQTGPAADFGAFGELAAALL